MRIKFFVGRSGTLFNDYLNDQRKSIEVQIENQIRDGKNELEVKSELKNIFTIEKFLFDNANGQIRDLNSDKLENRLKEGQLRNVLVKTYSYKIPFKGDFSLLKYRPNTFHGIERYVDVSGNYNTKENILEVNFESEAHNQVQFDHFKYESIGSLYENTNEFNNEIEEWNNRRLGEVINEIYPLVIAHLNQISEFEKRNNIIK